MPIEFLGDEAPRPSPGDYCFGEEAERYARFRLIHDDGDSWIGAFAGTGVNNNSFARSFGAGHVFVVSRGQGYVIDVARRTLRFVADYYLFDARAIPGMDLIVACCCTDLWVYSSEGELWTSDRIALDGIGLGEPTRSAVPGWCWHPDGWYGFTFFADGLRLEMGGLLSVVNDDYPDPLITHPPRVLPQDALPRGTAA